MDGNFYTTNEFNWKTSQGGLFPVLVDLNDGHEVHMPKPVAPIGRLLGSCNACHHLIEPALTYVSPPPEVEEPDPPGYIRLNNGISSYATATISHTDSRRGTDCSSGTCHSGAPNGAVFTAAGTVYDIDGGFYTLGDASIGLFPDACDNPPQCVSIDGEPDRRQTSLAFLEVDAFGNFYTTKPIFSQTVTTSYPTLANYDVITDPVTGDIQINCRNIQHMASAHIQPNCATTGCHSATNTINIDADFNAGMACIP